MSKFPVATPVFQKLGYDFSPLRIVSLTFPRFPRDQNMFHLGGALRAWDKFCVGNTVEKAQ